MRKVVPKLLVGLLAILGSSHLFASLVTFQTYTGANYGVSTSGWGSSSSSGTILTSVPTGATLVSAFLYSAYNFGGSSTVSLNGTNVVFTSNVVNATACCTLGTERADVTGIVSSALAAAGGPSGTPFGLAITEGSTGTQDGEELVTVYRFASGPDNTVAILDGFASVTGDTATLHLAAPATASTVAQLMIGDSFSCGSANGCASPQPGNNQASTITVNGTIITTNAGNNDDCKDPNAATAAANGCLITVGTNLNNGDLSVSDPFSPLLPTYLQDHERYNLTPQIHVGDTAITVNTVNASNDDNIFAAVFEVSGDASVSTGVPEPTTWLMLGSGVFGLVLTRRLLRN